MPHHVIVDGSNLATEGRAMPSLKQLHEAIAAYREDHPDALITVVVDATFGHRIDASEVPEFEVAIETNSFVAPPAGAVGRGDGFILSIAQKANAAILSNDSYQEFHGEYPWLFDEGRLIGGKPVPHVGWVFVHRVPVRGPVSRRSVKEQRIVAKNPTRQRRDTATTASVSANGPMPVPTVPPPSRRAEAPMVAEPAVTPAAKSAAKSAGRDRRGARAGQPTTAPDASTGPARQAVVAAVTTNELLPFLAFVESHPVGSEVTATIDSYSSHGAYVAVDDVKAYLPLRAMADPAPRSAREVFALGTTVTLIVTNYHGARRSIDLAVPTLAAGLTPTAPVTLDSVAADAGAPPAAQDAADAASEGGATSTTRRGRRGRRPDAVLSDTSSPGEVSSDATDAGEPAESTDPSTEQNKTGRGRRSRRASATASTPAPTAAPTADPGVTAIADGAVTADEATTPRPAARRSRSSRAATTGTIADQPAPPATTPSTGEESAATSTAAKHAPAKKAAAKQAPTKKQPAKQEPANKASARQETANNASAQQAPAKKAPAKKAPAMKPVARLATPPATDADGTTPSGAASSTANQAPATKSPAKKTPAKKTAATSPASEQAPAKRAPATKSAAKSPAAKGAPAKRAPAKQTRGRPTAAATEPDSPRG